MIDESLKLQVVENICRIQEEGCKVVIVHGGGPFIGAALEEAGIESEFIDGHRKTTVEALKYVERELKGNVNSELVGIINRLNYKAVGLSGKDGKMVTARKRKPQKKENGNVETLDLGQVGDVVKVDTLLLELMLDRNYIPVLTCLASDEEGMEYNINADMFAGHVAGALKAEEYVILTDVDGLLMDKHDPETLVNELSAEDAVQLVRKNRIEGGMLPKIESCIIAIEKGARKARILNGTKPEQIIDFLNDQKVGSVIRNKI